jgi:hypothetical protein
VCPMFTEPREIDAAALALQLEHHWGLSEPTLEYVPVGFGSHHWRATDSDGGNHFASVDDLTAPQHGGADVDAVCRVWPDLRPRATASQGSMAPRQGCLLSAR